MKSEHRHELKTNELAKWLENLPAWCKKNLRMIIYVSVVAAAVIAVAGYKWYTKNIQLLQQRTNLTNLTAKLPQDKMQIIQGQARGTDYSFVLIQTANQLEIIAENTKDDSLAAMAFIKQAELLRSELHYRTRPISEEEKTKQINNAKVIYAKAMEKSSSVSSLRAAAQFGLGLCEEELSAFKQARKMYQDILANEQFEGTAGAAQAKQRLEIMDGFQQKVVFRTKPTSPSEKPEASEGILDQFENPATSVLQGKTTEADANSTNQ